MSLSCWGFTQGTQRCPLQTNPPCEGHGPLTFTFTSQRVTDRCLRGAQARRLQPEHLQRRHGSKHAGGALQESRAHRPSHGTAPRPGPAWIARHVCPAVPDTLQCVACFPGEAVKARPYELEGLLRPRPLFQEFSCCRGFMLGGFNGT